MRGEKDVDQAFSPLDLGYMRGLLLAVLSREEYAERIATDLHIDVIREQLGAPVQTPVRITDLRLATSSELGAPDSFKKALLPQLRSLGEPITPEGVLWWKWNLLQKDEEMRGQEESEGERKNIVRVSFSAAALLLFLDPDMPDIERASPWRLATHVGELATIIRTHDIRAIESGDLQEEGAIARSRKVDEEDDFEGGELADDEEVVDYIAELSQRGWYRAETAFDAGDIPEDYSLDTDSVARRLRHATPIYCGPRSEEFLFCWDAHPLAVSVEDLFVRWANDDPEEGGRSTSWPSTPEEMSIRLQWAIAFLQAKARRCWNPGISTWYIEQLLWHPNDFERVCSEAYLHAERWRNEHTGEELLALVALREGWLVSNEAIEEAVWRRVTNAPDASDEKETEELPYEEFEL